MNVGRPSGAFSADLHERQIPTAPPPVLPELLGSLKDMGEFVAGFAHDVVEDVTAPLIVQGLAHRLAILGNTGRQFEGSERLVAERNEANTYTSRFSYTHGGYGDTVTDNWTVTALFEGTRARLTANRRNYAGVRRYDSEPGAISTLSVFQVARAVIRATRPKKLK